MQGCHHWCNRCFDWRCAMSPRLKLQDLSDAKVRKVCEQTHASILQLNDGIEHRLRELNQCLNFVAAALSSSDNMVAPTGIITSIENIAEQAAQEYDDFKIRQKDLF